MQKVKYMAVFLVYCTLFSCSDTDMSSTSSVNNTGDTFQAHIENVDNDEKYGENSIYHDSFLMIEDGTEQYTYELRSSYSDELHMCDVDGDNRDEIVINQLVGMAGGAGSFQSYVFDYENGEITEIFSSSNENQFDTGFSSKLKENSIVEFSNAFTGFSTEIDFYRNSRLFNEDGTVIEGKNDSEWAMFDSFREFVPEDIDGDGVYEISCLQFTSIDSHVEYVGDVQSYLKYNSDNKQFEVVKADFIPHNGNENKLTFS